MTWALDAFSRKLGTDGPDLVVATESLDLAELLPVAEEVTATPVTPEMDASSHLVRPLINARMGAFHARGSADTWASAPTLGGLNLLTATDPRFVGSSPFARGAARVLLYCHGLVIQDPVALGCDMMLSAAEDVRPLARRFVHAAIVTATEISELVDAGIVLPYWIPTNTERRTEELIESLQRPRPAKARSLTDEAWEAFEALFVDGLHPGLQDLWFQVRAGARQPDLSSLPEAARADPILAETFIDVVASLNSEVVVENVLESLAFAVEDVIHIGGAADLFAPSRLFARLLLAPTPSPGDVEALRIRELAKLDVPRLDDLTWRDVMSIRRDDATFAEWRACLGHGLDQIARFRAEGQYVEAGRLLQEELAPARAHLSEQTAKSSFTARMGSGAIAFVLGALGGAVGAIDQAPGSMVLAGLGAGLGAGAIASSARSTACVAAARRHYVLFDKPALSNEPS